MLYILTPIFCVSLLGGAVFSFSDNKVSANAATKNIETTMTVDETRQIIWNTSSTDKQTTIDYDSITGGGNHTIDTSTDKLISIYGTGYTGQGEAAYVGFTVTLTVPAWTKYEIDFPFDMQVVKTNSNTGGTVGRASGELLSYSSPTDEDPTVYTAANGGNGGSSVVFGKPYFTNNTANGYDGTATSGSNVTSELRLVQNYNTFYNALPTNNVQKKPLTGNATVEDTYENKSDNEVTIEYKFGFFATISSGTNKMGMGIEAYPTYLQLKPCTAEVTNLYYETPSGVSTPYTGTGYVDTNLTTISSITSASWFDTNAMTLSLPNGMAKDAGTYDLEVALKATGTTDNPWKLSNGTFTHDTQTVKLTINKVDPVISFGSASTTDQYTITGEKDEFPVPTVTYNSATVEGTITWFEDGPEGSAGGTRKDYHWTFTPTDTTNFNSKSGTISLNYVTPGIESITATFDSKGAAVYKSTPKATRDAYFTVMVKYAGIAEPKQSKSFETLGWDSGTNVPVTIKIGSALSSPVTIPEIGIDKIESLTAFLTQGSTKVTCETSKDTLKGMLQVLAKWNYANNNVTLAAADYDIDFTPVVGTNTSTLTVKYKNSDNTEVSATPTGNLTLEKAEYDMSGVKFENDTVTYDGKAHKIEISGTLPKGVTVSYAVTGQSVTELTDAGTYTYTASFAGDTSLYEDIDDMTATLNIEQADYPDADKIKFADKTVTHTGVEFSIEATDLPTGVTVTYVYNGGTPQTNPIKFKDVNENGYVITAKFSHTNANYKAISDKTAKLIITNKNTYDDSGLEFKATGAKGSGNSFTATYDKDSAISFVLDGKLKDKDKNEVTPTVTLEYQKKNGSGVWEPCAATDLKNAGEYKVIAKISTDDLTYADVTDKEITLTIDKADIDVDGAEFAPAGGEESGLKPAADGNGFVGTYREDGDYEVDIDPATLPVGTQKKGAPVYKKLKDGGNPANPDDWEVVAKPDGSGTYKVVFELEPKDPDNYNEIDPIEVTLVLSDRVVEKVTATVDGEAKFDINNTLDDLKKVISAEVEYNNGTKEAVEVDSLTLTCDTLRDGGKFEVGSQTITITYNDGTKDFTTTVEIVVAKAKVALPVYKGTLSYTGLELKPTANDFDGYNADMMTFNENKTVAGLNAGAYKAVFALKDSDRYEWATTTTTSKKLFAAAVFDGETEITLEANEAAVDWNIAKAKISAVTGEDGKPVFKSEGVSAAILAQAVGLKYYKDEACTQEIAADELDYETTYYLQADLLDSANFALENSVAEVVSVPYTTPAKELTFWEKVVKFLTSTQMGLVVWLWIVIALVALILLITILALAARASKNKKRRLAEEKAERERKEEERERREEERREREEERRREEREERMARMSQPQMQMPAMMPQMMPQMQMPQPQPQYAPQQQPVQPVMGGGSVDSAQITRIETELATLKAAQAAKELAELKAEQAAMRSDLNALRGSEQTGGISIDAMTEIMTAALKNVLATATQQAIAGQPAQPAQLTDGTTAPAAPAATQVPPDAVMTTVTTTKIDTTKKTAQNGQGNAQTTRTTRSFVPPMPVDDGRVFDVGGFYKPADPVDLVDDEDNK